MHLHVCYYGQIKVESEYCTKDEGKSFKVKYGITKGTFPVKVTRWKANTSWLQ